MSAPVHVLFMKILGLLRPLEPKNNRFKLPRPHVRWFTKNCHLRTLEQLIALWLIFISLFEETLDSNLLVVMNVVFMKNFDLTVWSKSTANKAHFGLLSQKYLINLCRHLVRYIHKNFSSRGLEQNISASLAQNTRSIFRDIMYVVDPNFLVIIHVLFMKISYFDVWNKLTFIRLISAF